MSTKKHINLCRLSDKRRSKNDAIAITIDQMTDEMYKWDENKLKEDEYDYVKLVDANEVCLLDTIPTKNYKF